MGAFIGIGDTGIWASNGERDAFLDWFAEHRCVSGDARWQWCKSEGQRYSGRFLDLSEFLQDGEAFEVTEAELSVAAQTHNQFLARLLKQIKKIHRGEWKYTVETREAVHWKSLGYGDGTSQSGIEGSK